MIHLLLVRLRVNRLRVIALVLGVAAATTAFVVLTGQVAEQRLELRGRVSAQASPNYDILVRPAGSRTALEQREGLVRANFLSGQFGGITLAQWHRIQQLAGVQVAAPIAMVGYVLQTARIPLDLTDRLDSANEQLFTASTTRTTARGRTSFDQKAISYSYVSTAPVRRVGDPDSPEVGVQVVGPAGPPRLVCPVRGKSALSPLTVRAKRNGACWSRENGWDGDGFDTLPRGHAGIVVQWTFPFLLAAIDPEQEAALSGLKGAVGQGSYLPERGSTVPGRIAGSLPVLMAEQAGFDDQDDITIERLKPAATAQAGAGLRVEQLDALLESAAGTVVRRTSFSAEQAYQLLLSKSLHATSPPFVDSYWTSGPISYRTDPDGTLRPLPVTNPISVWQAPVQYQGTVLVPPDVSDTSFRRLSQHPVLRLTERGVETPRLAVVGTFDQSRLKPSSTGGSDEPLGGYRTQPLTPADPASSEQLKGQPLLPDSNIAGYLLPAPTLLTSLDAASVFTDSAVFDHVSDAAPISAVRVRVAGVRGTDPVSRERVRLAAEAIAGATGLDVDVTVGSAPTSRQLVLPAGSAGRPALRLTEQWQRKGVVVQALRAIDRKSALLFTLVLVVCGMFIANAAGAGARSPRMELSTLSCLGWTRGQLMRLLLGEMAVIGAAAGLLGTLVAVLAARSLGVPVSTGRALVAAPAALAITLLAAAWPVWRASVPVPLPGTPAAPRTGAGRIGGRRLRGLSQLAYRNLRAEPGRTGLGMAAVGVGSAGLTLLLAITVTFRGSVVGSVLGDAISLQARRVDYLAVAITLLLAAVAVADVSYLNMRERREDLSLLRAVGWTGRQLGRLVVAEGALLGLAGAVAGAGLGVLVTAVLADSVPGSLWLLAGLTALGGTLLSASATALAVLSLPLLVRTPSLTAD